MHVVGIGADLLILFAVLAIEVVGEFTDAGRRADAVVRTSVADEGREKAMRLAGRLLELHMSMSISMIQTE